MLKAGRVNWDRISQCLLLCSFLFLSFFIGIHCWLRSNADYPFLHYFAWGEQFFKVLEFEEFPVKNELERRTDYFGKSLPEILKFACCQ